MIRATGAKFRMLASYTSCLSAREDDPRPSPGDLEGEERCRDMGKEKMREGGEFDLHEAQSMAAGLGLFLLSFALSLSPFLSLDARAGFSSSSSSPVRAIGVRGQRGRMQAISRFLIVKSSLYPGALFCRVGSSSQERL